MAFLTDGAAFNAEGLQNGIMLSMMLLVSVSLNVKNEVIFLKIMVLYMVLAVL